MHKKVCIRKRIMISSCLLVQLRADLINISTIPILRNKNRIKAKGLQRRSSGTVR